MSIPIDKLYHYIESIAQDICGDSVLIYRFYPHGSKKLEDCTYIRKLPFVKSRTVPILICYDQEPLNYDFYKNQSVDTNDFALAFDKYNLTNLKPYNLKQPNTIYDKVLLVHSERRSSNLEKYINDDYISVYYWSHAIIALDWYRYARYESFNKNTKKTFLIYNRAWSGSREYRLKFIDLLIKNNLISFCQTTINPIEPELGIHYAQHNYLNNNWIPDCVLEDFVCMQSTANSSASADYDIDDYNTTEFEVVLETLFDDDRLQLTEKIFRPIALNQPFILASTKGSLEYLRSYGFKTFNSIIDESYDDIENSKERLEAIVQTMKAITLWTEEERNKNMLLINEITEYNRQHFFSDNFFNQVVEELKTNISIGLKELEDTNTSANYFIRRKKMAAHQELKDFLLSANRQDIATVVKKARQYYIRSLGKE